MILLVAVVLVGCTSGPNENTAWPTPSIIVEPTVPATASWVSAPSNPNNVKIEKAIRKAAKKPTGEFTKADLEKMPVLSLGGKRLADVKGLEKLMQLTELALQFGQLTDVKALENLTQLTNLVLSDNNLTDVKSFEKLTKLERLVLDNNPDLTKAQIDQLQKALPKCKIYSNFDEAP